MKKCLLLMAAILLLPGCADKNDYKEAVQTEMEKEKDLKDYHITAEQMSDCVVELSSQKMPGFFALDPARMTAYRNYTKMLTMMNAADPKKVMDELRVAFGSPKALADAHANFTESVLECYTAVVSKTEDEEDDSDEKELDDDDESDSMQDQAGEDMDESEGMGNEPELTVDDEVVEDNDEPQEMDEPDGKEEDEEE